jgi:hypothetical protein
MANVKRKYTPEVHPDLPVWPPLQPGAQYGTGSIESLESTFNPEGTELQGFDVNRRASFDPNEASVVDPSMYSDYMEWPSEPVPGVKKYWRSHYAPHTGRETSYHHDTSGYKGDLTPQELERELMRSYVEWAEENGYK